MDLSPVLDFVFSHYPALDDPCQGWVCSLKTNGRNNRLIRAQRDDGADIAIKIYRIDKRDRAGREYKALLALEKAGLRIAPRALLIDKERYPHPVVVQTWVEGRVIGGPPDTPAAWTRLVDHYCAIHSVCPSTVDIDLEPAFMTFQCARDAVDAVLKEISGFPVDALRPGLAGLIDTMLLVDWPEWTEPALCLDRCDPSPENIIDQPEAWVSVDWEYAGWGDPGFEIGDLMAHPLYQQVGDNQWDLFLSELQAAKPGDLTFRIRARVYYAIQLVRFTAVFSNYWLKRDTFEDDPGRLGAFPADWWASLPDQYNLYLERAKNALADVKRFC